MKKVRKQNKLGSLLVTVLIITMISIVMISTLMDQQKDGLIDQAQNTVESSYNAVSGAVSTLKKNIEKLNNAIKKLNGVDIGVSDWEGASDALKAKIEEVEAFEKEYFASFVNEKKTLTYKDYFNYEINKVAVVDVFTNIKNEALLNLQRAISVADMNKIVENYKKEIKAIPTNLDNLYATIEEINKNGVELKDYDKYVLALNIFASIKKDIFALDPTNEVYEETALTETLEGIFAGLQDVTVATFIDTVNSLPKNVNLINLAHKDTVAYARELYNSFAKNGLYTAEELEKLENKSFHKAEDAFVTAEKHMTIVLRMYGEVDEETKKPIEGNNALWINAQIASYKGVKIDATPATMIWIEKLVDLVDAWDDTTWVEYGYSYTLVTNAKSKDFCADLYDMIDRATLESYVKAYSKLTATLKEEADFYIKKVANLPAVTHTSGSAIEVLELIYKEDLQPLMGTLKPEEVDFLLGYGASNGLNNAYLTYLDYKAAYEQVLKEKAAALAKIETMINDLLTVECKKNHNGAKCDCELVINEAKVVEIDALLANYLGTYAATEDVVESKLLASYKTARLTAVKNAALANAKAAYEATDVSFKEDAYKAVLAIINRDANVEYTLTVKLDNGTFVLVENVAADEKAPSTRLAEFTVDECTKLINSYVEK